MSRDYVALYRRYRPRHFAEVVGQAAVVESLTRALAGGRFAHAYLFCGPRGTGKTSMARLLARAVNCEKLSKKGEPCDECAPCVAFLEGRLVDVHEIDAASNRRIAEMRDLLDQVGYTPTLGRYKVYILDEAHMLTVDAANAFLKTLEEPPPHVLFVMATTEAHKILPTISSRCQVYEFRKIGEEACAGLLEKVAAAEGVELGEGVARFVALRAGGAMRDALALLERLVSTCEGRVTREDAVEALGLVPEGLLVDLAAAILERRPEAVYRVVDEVAKQGRDTRRLLVDAVSILRDLLRACCGAKDALVAYSPAVTETLAGLARAHEVPRFLSVLNRLDRGLVEARGALLPDFAVELTLLEALHVDVIYGREDLERRMAALEEGGARPEGLSSRSLQDFRAPRSAGGEPGAAPPPPPGGTPPAPASPRRGGLRVVEPAADTSARDVAPPPVVEAPPAAPVAASPDAASTPTPAPPPGPAPAPAAAPRPEAPPPAAAPPPRSPPAAGASSPPEAGPAAGPPVVASAPPASRPADPPFPEDPPPNRGGGRDLTGTWSQVLDRARREHPITYGMLREAKLVEDGSGGYLVSLPGNFSFHHGRLGEAKHRGVVGTLLKDALGGDLAWDLHLDEAAAAPSRGRRGGGRGGGGRGRRPPEDRGPPGPREDGGPGPPSRKRSPAKQGRDWYEEKALAHPKVQAVVEMFEGQVLGVD